MEPTDEPQAPYPPESIGIVLDGPVCTVSTLLFVLRYEWHGVLARPRTHYPWTELSVKIMLPPMDTVLLSFYICLDLFLPPFPSLFLRVSCFKDTAVPAEEPQSSHNLIVRPYGGG